MDNAIRGRNICGNNIRTVHCHTRCCVYARFYAVQHLYFQLLTSDVTRHHLAGQDMETREITIGRMLREVAAGRLGQAKFRQW